MSLSIIVPTIGRPTLHNTLVTIRLQLAEEDEVLVVGDGKQPEAKEIVSQFGGRMTYMESPGPARDWGATPRNYGIERAQGTHFVFMDDDDVFLPNAFDAFRMAIEENPDKPQLFKMYREGKVLWEEPVVKVGNVSTQMYLIPNVPGKVGRWTREYEGDFHFLKETLSYYPEGHEAIVWMNKIVASLTTHKKGVF